jgi:hypothetical protein
MGTGYHILCTGLNCYNLLALGEYQAQGREIKSHGRNDLIFTPPQPSATPLI